MHTVWKVGAVEPGFPLEMQGCEVRAEIQPLWAMWTKQGGVPGLKVRGSG